MTDENYEEIDLAKDIEKVNRFARRELSPEEIYCFPLVLCDNEPDRDNERFSVSALEELAKLFVGKTGIFDHDPKGKNQTARIYEAQVLTDPEKTTSDGEVYTYLFAKAYIMKSEKNSDLIKEIDGGIKKEVSVSCSVKKKICSVCGRDIFKKSCAHKKGEVYNGKSCVHILDEPSDAYEWSFVAVPAQKNAGIKKNCTSDSDRLCEEVSRLLYLADTVLPLSVIKKLVYNADKERLCEIKTELEKKLSKRPVVQLCSELALKSASKKNNNSQFRL